MNKKILYQFFLASIVIIIIYIIFSKYFITSDKDLKIIKKFEEKFNTSIKDTSSTIMKDIKYTSVDSSGSIFTITSEKAEINIKNQSLTMMEKVKAKIILEDLREVLIFSDFAIYNNDNYNTIFKDNVLIDFMPHYISANYLDLMFEKNLLNMYENIVYKNQDTKLYADKLELDLISKDTKIFMNNKLDKINIFLKN